MGAVLSGVIASIIAIVIWELFSVLRDNRNFHRLIGHYTGFAFQDGDANPLQRGKEQSEAQISYAGLAFAQRFAILDRNMLKIAVTHGPNKEYEWKGLIAMQSKSFGTVDWRYTRGVRGESFGAKWLIVSDQVNDLSLYVVEFVRPESFGKEGFTKKEK